MSTASRALKALALVAVCAGTLTSSLTARAGDVLRLKTGTIDPLTITEKLETSSRLKKPQVYVVQFESAVNHADQLNLSTLGAEILRYLPDDALVVRATPREAATIERSSQRVRAVVAYSSAWKFSPSFTAASVFNSKSEAQAHVRLFPFTGRTPAQVKKLTSQAASQIASLPGVTVDQADGRSLLVRGTRASLEAVANNEAVEWIQPEAKFQLLSFDGAIENENPVEQTGTGDYTDLKGYETGTKLMGFDATWAKGLTGKGQIAAMADTGLDTGDLAAVNDFQGRVTEGHIFGFFSKTWADPMGHGTHVAGSVLGSGAQSKGALKGGAYEASLVAQSMWSPMMGGLAIPSKLSDMYGKAYTAGARVHTNSWGKVGDFGGYDSFAQQTDEFTAANPDMLVIFAAGNSGVDMDKDGRIDPNSIGSPGTAKNVLTVGASKNYVMNGGYQKKMSELRQGKEHWGVEPIASSMLSENPQGLAAFSSRGPTQDGRLKPEIVAPGTNILSTRSHDPKAEVLWGVYNDQYVWSGGTSMATPLTAGAALLVRQYLIEQRKIANPSGALVKAALVHSATDLFPGQFGEVGKAKGQELLTRRPNIDEGYGRVDVAKATDLGKAIVVDERAGLATGESHTYPLKVSASAKMTATLVYTDAPGAAAAAKALVNDLDLVVVNMGDGKEMSLNDHINNNEMFERSVPSGDYEIRVKGTSVPQGPVAAKQPYALIISVQ